MVKIAVQGVFHVSGQGVLIVGTVLGGVMKAGMQCHIKEYVIVARSMESGSKLMSQAKEGQTVGMAIVKLSGPKDPPKSFFHFFSKGRYVDIMKMQKGRVLEFEEPGKKQA